MNDETLSDNESQEIKTAFSFVESEREILKFWQAEKIFNKSLEQTRQGKPYIFYDGPPFATGLPHHGHIVASTLKDIVPRFFTMKGYYVSRRWGWDCHGLPIEQEIDKKFGQSAQETVKAHGVKFYNRECRSIVQRYTEEWRKTIDRLGRWVDFDHDYRTMDLFFMESVWWVLKELWDNDLIYRGNKVVPISTAFGTVLSNFEATSNYQQVQDPSLTVRFEMQEKLAGEKCSLLAWTTTPWTLPSNLALCVNASLDYHLVRDEDLSENFIIAATRLEHYRKSKNYKILETFPGEFLKGKKYRPLMPYFSTLERDGAFVVLTDDYVNTENGTGIVHLAPAFGEDDFRILKAAQIPAFACPVDVHGKFTSDVPELAGTPIKDADKIIIKKLKAEHKIFEQSVISHSYPFCPRTDTPLIYRAIESWYVSVEKIKEQMLAANSEINWVPTHIKEGRFGKWLEGARDWAISRNRYWGTPIPLWENDVTGKILCIGSLEELKKYTGVTLDDLHRENVDPLTFKCPGEEGTYHRISDVLDCWFESGSMPYAQLHYPFENKELFQAGFPAEFIAEGLDQTRGWFYTLTVLSAALFKRPAFKNVIVNGMVLAADGKKMSKRLRNYTPPDALMETYGADALRLFLINSGVVRGEELRFTDEGVKEMVRRVLLPWYNSFKFFQTYASVDGWNPKEHFSFGDNILDCWIISRLQSLIQKVNNEMESYRLFNVVPALFQFIEELTNTYIRFNRRRFWSAGLEKDKMEAYSTLYTTILDISTLMAPFAPFLSEHIFQELMSFGGLEKNSIHLQSYPQADIQRINTTLEEAVERMHQVIILGRQKRNLEQIKVKMPLARLTIIHKNQDLLDEIKKLESIIKTELNVKNVKYSANENQFINLFAKPNAPILGKRLGKNYNKFRMLIEKLDHSQLDILEAGESLSIEGETFLPEEILVYREPHPGTQALSNRLISIDLDCQLSKSLFEEGLAREVVSRIQKTRKDMNFHVADRISMQYFASEELKKVIEENCHYIQEETLTISLEWTEEVKEKNGVQKCLIEKFEFWPLLKKI